VFLKILKFNEHLLNNINENYTTVFYNRFQNSVTSTMNGEASTSLVTEFGTKGIGCSGNRKRGIKI